MHDTTTPMAVPAGRRISIATYAAIGATILIMVLSALTFATTSREGTGGGAYDPSVSVLGFAEPE